MDRGGGPIFKRRHFDNPWVFNLLITNYAIVFFGLSIFDSSHHKIHWFFWVVAGLLGVWNIFRIYKQREEITTMSIIAYVVGLAGLPLIFLMF